MTDDLLPGDVRVEGVRLNSHAYNVDLKTGFTQMPERVLLGVPAPRVDGVVPIPGRFQPPTISISMWISSVAADGSLPSGRTPAAQFEKNLDAVIAAFVAQSATITVEHKMPDGSIRIAECRVAGSVVPDRPQPGSANPYGRCVWTLDIPGVFWRDADGPFTASYTTIGSQVDLTFLDPSTAPVTDATYKVDGPITNPRLDNPYGGYIAYNGTVPAGSTWVVDAKEFTSKVNGASVMKDTDYFHNAKGIFEVWPTYQVTLSGSGTSSATKLTVVADRKFF